ncbi:MAG: Npt1/Npt2 family nucleotide transporter [Planctomycetota bacterium]|nr:Npt1/Npt2 family nucleotide transporter [Planctomycetota bacterium]
MARFAEGAGAGTQVSGLFSKETRERIALRPGEGAIVLWAATYFFFVLASWSLLRPVREQLGIVGEIRDLKWLFLVTWTVMLALQPVYGYVVGRLPRARFVPLIYRFFATTLLAFFLALRFVPAEHQLAVGRAFYVWSSVLNLWTVSVFWSFLADQCGSARAKRLYPWIAVGGTVGSILGGLVVWPGLQIVDHLAGAGAANAAVPWLLIAALVLLEVGVRCVGRLQRLFDVHGEALGLRAAAEPALIGGSALEGLRAIIVSPYLIRIGAYMLCYAVTGTLLYFAQADIVRSAFDSSAERTQAFAMIDVVTQCLTLVVQVFVTRRLVAAFGLGASLAVLPIVAGLSFLTLWVWPVFGVLVISQALRRAARYAVTKPTGEVLYSVLPREQKYKAKGAIDTLVYRTGDALGALTSLALGVLAPGMALVTAFALPVVGAWSWLAGRLGRDHAARSRDEGES